MFFNRTGIWGGETISDRPHSAETVFLDVRFSQLKKVPAWVQLNNL